MCVCSVHTVHCANYFFNAIITPGFVLDAVVVVFSPLFFHNRAFLLSQAVVGVLFKFLSMQLVPQALSASIVQSFLCVH